MPANRRVLSKVRKRWRELPAFHAEVEPVYSEHDLGQLGWVAVLSKQPKKH
ncbi:MAG: hypothetical protein HY392_02555 [Candidatus Diapherotrites archaeon]|nr:hypothetical protein [Candidatus Diapherotrites archaeon]